MNRHKLVINNNYLLLVDNQGFIREGDYYLYKDMLEIHHIKRNKTNGGIPNKLDIKEPPKRKLVDCKLVVAYYPLVNNLSELDLPFLPDPFRSSLVTSYMSNLFDLEKSVRNQKKLSYNIGFLKGLDEGGSIDKVSELAEEHKNEYTFFSKSTQEAKRTSFIDGYVDGLKCGFIPSYEKVCPYEFTSRCTYDRCDCDIKLTIISDDVDEVVGYYFLT